MCLLFLNNVRSKYFSCLLYIFSELCSRSGVTNNCRDNLYPASGAIIKIPL
jgi:hypothetical protein